MRIILAGGGTGGPAAPLLAVAQKIKEKKSDVNFLFVGTSSGPEKKMVEETELEIEFIMIPAGKWRRYFSLKNLAAPFLVVAGFFKSISLIKKFKPDLIFAAGGYVSVPLILAGALLRKKIVIHQQDILPGLTNKILAPFASAVTVSFSGSLKDFSSNSGLFGQNSSGKVVHTGNPVRKNILKKISAAQIKSIKNKYAISEQLPVILILGGATGALQLNQIIREALPDLLKFAYVIHSTGAGKQISFEHPRYRQFEFIENIAEVYALADIVISRAGLSTISELSALGKVSVIIPMPNSHQLYNALFLKQANAALVLNQELLGPESLVSSIKKIMYDGEWQAQLKANISALMPKNADEKIAEILIKLCSQN